MKKIYLISTTRFQSNTGKFLEKRVTQSADLSALNPMCDFRLMSACISACVLHFEGLELSEGFPTWGLGV